MRLPWVSRETFEMMVRQYEAVIGHYTLLLTHQLSSAMVPIAPDPFPPPAVTPPRQEDPIAECIRGLAQGDAQLASYFRKRAQELKAEGKGGQDIVTELNRWQSSEDVA